MSIKLSAEQQELLNCDFGEEMEKAAAIKVAACQEAYTYGFSKLAEEVADQEDEAAKEKEEKKEEEKEEAMEDEESEKAAAQLGAFIERGFFEGLRKLGSERHGDELHYLVPYLQEKVAANAVSKAFSNLGKQISKGKDKAVEGVKSYHKGMGQDFSSGYQGLKSALLGTAKAPGKGKKMVELSSKKRKEMAVQGAKSLGMGALKASPYAAVAGGGLYAANKALGSKDEQQQ